MSSRRSLFGRSLSLSKKLSNPISQYIDSEQWERVIGLAQSKPDLCKQWTERIGFFEGVRPANVLPLREACANESVPLDVIHALVEAYPESVRVTESAYHRLPLHIVCRKTISVQVVHFLLEENAGAALEPDALGRLPLHYALSNGAHDEVVDMLLQYGPDAARGVDRKGWSPLHVACSMGASTRVTNRLLQLYPEASVLATHRGTSVLSCMRSQYSPNKDEVVALVKQYQEQVDSDVGKSTPRLDENGHAEADRTHHVIV